MDPICMLALAVALAAQDPTPYARVSLADAPRLHLEAPQLFDANLPGCLRLRWSPDGLIALAEHEPFRITDAKAGTATQWTTGSDQRVQDVAAWAHGFVRLLLDSVGMITVEALAHGTWQELRGKPTGPELRCAPTLAAADSYPFLAADGERIVLITDTTLYGYRAGEWSSSAFTLDPDEPARSIHRVLLDRETLYLGTDMGEWGGELYSMDLETKQVTRISAAWKPGTTNVADLDRGPDGRIWATIGLDHGDGSGAIYVRNGSAWNCIANTSGSEKLRDQPDSQWPVILETTNPPGELPWKLAPAGFIALDFDLDGRAYLLTEEFGLYRLEDGGRWSWITPGWPDWGALASDLAILGRTAVISSRTAGVIVVDLDTLAARRVRIER